MRYLKLKVPPLQKSAAWGNYSLRPRPRPLPLPLAPAPSPSPPPPPPRYATIDDADIWAAITFDTLWLRPARGS